MTGYKDIFKVKHPKIYGIFSGISKILKKPTKYPRELIRYAWCKYTNTPYFGFIMAAGQTSEKRKPYMKKSVKLGINNLTNNEIQILEIGSWAGNSAIIWADSIKQLNAKGLVICVDPWKPYIDSEQNIDPETNISISEGPLRMERALIDDKIYNLFLHNIKAAGHSDIIKPYRGSSDEVLPTLRDNKFNLVYVDGSHFYSQVIIDLRNCERLVAEGGGDDLEMQLYEVDLENAKEKKECDFILDPKTNKYFHPGVTLAVAEYFGGEVSCFEGFWIMKKTNSGWEKIVLDH